MTKLRIMVVDDHAVVREGLKSLINSQPDMMVVGEAGDASEVLERITELPPDIVVMDLFLPGMSGTEATEQIKQRAPDVKVLALTFQEDRAFVMKVLGMGASGYVLKRAASEQLLQAVRSVAGGGVYIDPSIAGKVLKGVVGRPTARSNLNENELSEREAEVLKLVAKGHTNKEMAALLELSVKTIETYKTRFMEKLRLSSRAEIVAYAIRRGWLE